MNILSVFVLLIGLGFIFYFIIIWWKAKKTLNWPKVSGKVLQSEVRASGDGGQLKKHVLKYEYEVGGITFTSDKKIYGFSIGRTKTTILKQVEKYPVGSDVSVFYDPMDHSRALIKLGVLMDHYFWLLMGFIMVLSAVFFELSGTSVRII
ncbi:MAG: DUF3592 domain-containing protein [Candidatus Hodarchaeales archaeon]|jgi:hypothetical protein